MAYQTLWVNIKAMLVEEQLWYNLTQTWGESNGVHTFPKGISLKVNVKVQLEFKLTMTSQSSTLATTQ